MINLWTFRNIFIFKMVIFHWLIHFVSHWERSYRPVPYKCASLKEFWEIQLLVLSSKHIERKHLCFTIDHSYCKFSVCREVLRWTRCQWSLLPVLNTHHLSEGVLNFYKWTNKKRYHKGKNNKKTLKFLHVFESEILFIFLCR